MIRYFLVLLSLILSCGAPPEDTELKNECALCSGGNKGDSLGLEPISYLSYGIIDFVNESDEDLLLEVKLDKRAYAGILERRPFLDILDLDESPYMGKRAFSKLSNYISSHHLIPTCGDGKIQLGLEGCDDGNVFSGDGCTPSCLEELPPGVVDGGKCSKAQDCEGGYCILAYPGGYCTTLSCFDDSGCNQNDANNIKCHIPADGSTSYCLESCEEKDLCREGYSCGSTDEKWCAPDPGRAISQQSLDDLPFPVKCAEADSEGSLVLPYEIAADSSSYLITMFNKKSRQLVPSSITLPDGETIDFDSEYEQVLATMYKNMYPLQVPAGPAFESQLQAGTHKASIKTESKETCFYLVEETTPGTEIDLNIHFVGVVDLNASNAETHAAFQDVFARFTAIYAKAGFTIGKIRYIDVTGEDAERFSVIRSADDISDLVLLSKAPGKSREEALSVNVFFVQSFLIEGGTIGQSKGIPGAAGFFGTGMSGLAFTTEYMGESFPQADGSQLEGNNITAQTLAHEIGHFLGLRHTTESSPGLWDLLEDTPECDDVTTNPDCPDLDNLMYPFVGSNETLTPDQSFVIGTSMLTKEKK